MSEQIQTFEEEFEPEPEFVVDDLDALKVMADPMRLRILESLVVKPMTVKEVARQLGSTPTKLYYHVNLLEERGMIKVVSQRIVSGIIEKQYRTRAFSFKVAKGLFALSGDEDNGMVDTMLNAIFASTQDDIRNAIKQGLFKPDESDPLERNGILFRSITKLNQQQLRGLQKKLVELVEEYCSNELIKEQETEGNALATYGITVAVFPLVEEIPNNTTIID